MLIDGTISKKNYDKKYFDCILEVNQNEMFSQEKTGGKR